MSLGFYVVNGDGRAVREMQLLFSPPEKTRPDQPGGWTGLLVDGDILFRYIPSRDDAKYVISNFSLEGLPKNILITHENSGLKFDSMSKIDNLGSYFKKNFALGNVGDGIGELGKRPDSYQFLIINDSLRGKAINSSLKQLYGFRSDEGVMASIKNYPLSHLVEMTMFPISV